MNQKTARLLRRYSRANKLAYRSAKAWFITEPRPRRHWLKNLMRHNLGLPAPWPPHSTSNLLYHEPKT